MSSGIRGSLEVLIHFGMLFALHRIPPFLCSSNDVLEYLCKNCVSTQTFKRSSSSLNDRPDANLAIEGSYPALNREQNAHTSATCYVYLSSI
jgi:hypothetical protein